ncbi:MAG: hypothetical protein ACREV9_14655 [Burkholderiales bacterium]
MMPNRAELSGTPERSVTGCVQPGAPDEWGEAAGLVPAVPT